MFFGLERIWGRMIVLVCLWLSVLGSMISFFAINTLAGLLMAPYLLWVSVAEASNLAVRRMNPVEAT